MDCFGYLMMLTIMIGIIVMSFVLLNVRKSRILFIFPSVLSVVCFVMFGGYIYGINLIPHIDGIPITFFMRLFMLDDTVNKCNIQIGLITSSLFVVICIVYMIIFTLLYKRKKHQ